MDAYLSPANAQASAKLLSNFNELSIGSETSKRELNVNGRTITIKKAAEGVGLTNFYDMCIQPLGAGDYLALADAFHTFILDGVPKLGPNNRDQSKRFMILIDALYDHKTKFICSAETLPSELYTEGDGVFEFERTVSRLIEMQSSEYMALPHGSKDK
jgi:cell division protein ZapE